MNNKRCIIDFVKCEIKEILRDAGGYCRLSVSADKKFNNVDDITIELKNGKGTFIIPIAIHNIINYRKTLLKNILHIIPKSKIDINKINESLFRFSYLYSHKLFDLEPLSRLYFGDKYVVRDIAWSIEEVIKMEEQVSDQNDIIYNLVYNSHIIHVSDKINLSLRHCTGKRKYSYETVAWEVVGDSIIDTLTNTKIFDIVDIGNGVSIKEHMLFGDSTRLNSTSDIRSIELIYSKYIINRGDN